MDCEVVCIDNFSRIPADDCIEEIRRKKAVTWIEDSIENVDLSSLFRNSFDYIYHLATINGTDNFYSQPFTVIESIVTPTFELIRAIRDSNSLPRRFFLASTSEVYASMTELGFSKIPTSENTVVGIDDVGNERWSYAAGKIAVESALINAGKQYGFKWTIGRFHNVYGPRMGKHHFIPDYISRVLRQEFKVYGPNQTRSFTYISDAVDQTIQVTTNSITENRIVNLGSEEEMEIQEVARIILALMNLGDRDFQRLDAPRGSVSRRVPNLAFLKSITGDLNQIPLSDGLRSTINWYKNHEY